MNRLTRRLEQGIQGGLLALVALMPFHAFLSVWLGTTLGHRALIQSWKEVLLVILCGLAIWLVIREPERLGRLRQPAILVAGAFLAIALIVTALLRPGFSTALYGLKIDGEFLVAFGLATLVAAPAFGRRLVTTALASASLVVVFGLLQSTVLPPDFLIHFGYGPTTVLPYEHLQAGVSSLRFGSTLGGPNQLGTYLIIPLSLWAVMVMRDRRWWLALAFIPGLWVMIHTYSRGAWIGLLAALAVVSLGLMTRTWRRWTGVGMGAVIVIIALLSPIWLKSPLIQHYALHGATLFQSGQGSDYQHLDSLRQGLSAIAGAPLGHGLGTAGPAVFFTGSGRIFESYYLQVGYETGLLGLVLFGALVILVGRGLWRRRLVSPAALGLVAALIGISINALVLPVWTDSTGALTFWILAGALAAVALTSEPHYGA